MSEETKKTAEAPAEEQTAPQAEQTAAPEEQQAAAPEAEETEKADGKKKDGFFNKKARELEAVKAKLDAAEKNANQAKDQLRGWPPSTKTTASAPPGRPTRSSTMACLTR